MGERNKLLELIKYYVRKGRFKTIKRGIYFVGKQYNKFELAQKIIALSYISLRTALGVHGLVFQYQSTIECISLKSRNLTIGKQKISYHKIKADIFFNSLGLEQKENYVIASMERAICDSMYFYPNISLDHVPSKIDIKKLRQISKIYDNKSLEKRISQFIKQEC